MEREGLAALFDALYADHARGIHAFLLGRTGDPAAADDLLQEVYLRAWRRLEDVVVIPPGRRRYWLYRVARNLVTDHYRRRAVRVEGEQQSVPPLAAALSDAAGTAPPGPSLEAMDLEASIARLPEELRVALTMRYAGGLTSAEIGEALGCPAGTVRYRLSMARRRLARMLADKSPAGAQADVKEGSLVHHHT